MSMMGGCVSGMGLFGLLSLVVLVAAIAGVMALFRGFGRGGQGKQLGNAVEDEREDRALVLLRERFARGEIDREEYEDRRHALVAGEMGWAR